MPKNLPKTKIYGSKTHKKRYKRIVDKSFTRKADAISEAKRMRLFGWNARIEKIGSRYYLFTKLQSKRKTIRESKKEYKHRKKYGY